MVWIGFEPLTLVEFCRDIDGTGLDWFIAFARIRFLPKGHL